MMFLTMLPSKRVPFFIHLHSPTVSSPSPSLPPSVSFGVRHSLPPSNSPARSAVRKLANSQSSFAAGMGNKITRRRTFVNEQYTRPQGLYPPHDFDYKKLRRLILDSKLAPCYPGTEDFSPDLDECPICFMFYPSLNRSKCCTKGICTECFLQVKSPQATCPTQCPFCKTPNYAVEYRGAKSLEEKGIEQAEEQKVIEAKIRMRQKELQDEEERLQRREAVIEGNTEADRSPIRENSLEGSWGLGDSYGRAQESHPEVLTNAEESRSTHPFEMNLRTVTAHCQATRRPSFSSMHTNRDEEFDFDIEDIMVMEAIWLSIQNQSSHHASYVQSSEHDMVPTSSGTNQAFMSDHDSTTTLPVSVSASARDVWTRSSATGGFAGAIAALAERQVFGIHSVGTWQSGDDPNGCEDHSSVVTEYQNTFSKEPLHVIDSDRENAEDQSTLDYSFQAQSYRQMDSHVDSEAEQVGIINSDLGDERDQLTWIEAQETNFIYKQESSPGINGWLASDIREGSSGSMSEWVPDQSSEAVEVGTSFSSSIPSASELPWETPDTFAGLHAEVTVNTQVITTPAVIVPETFEEQMMLAMALSLAEAHAHSR